jgi:hypothetical protein
VSRAVTPAGRCAAWAASTAFFAWVWLLAAPAQAQQELGQKVLGTLGLQAGTQPKPGVYVVDQFAFHNADELVDRNGNPLPVGLDLHAVGDAFGLAATLEVRPLATYVGAAVGVPMAKVAASTRTPPLSTDRFGFGDLFVQPLKLGWRTNRADVVAGYGFYAPTGRYEPVHSDGIGRGHWTQEPSLGGTVYLDTDRTLYASALSCIDVNSRNRGIDITRATTLQVQGGLGMKVLRIFDVGVAGYALWQLSDNSGNDAPAALRRALERAYGLGPEVDVTLPPIRSRLTARYEHDIAVASRQFGQIVYLGLTAFAWDLASKQAPEAR